LVIILGDRPFVYEDTQNIDILNQGFKLGFGEGDADVAAEAGTDRHVIEFI
jgi:hypothetical protein